MLGRTRQVAPRVVPLGSGGELIDLDATELKPLIPRFHAFLSRRLPEPNTASAQTLEYLGIRDIPRLYLRGNREAGKAAEWFTQVGFSGCAGMAEVSALVACHWAAAWAQEEMPVLEREIFGPFGFTPTPDQSFGLADERFLPVAELGYLRYVPADEREAGGLVFEVDHAVVEAIENAEERLADASARHGSLMADSRCRCQLCAPA
jgi:hypothetical protein